MANMYSLLTLLAIIGSVVAADCTGRQDGDIVEYTCFSYFECQNSVTIEIKCPLEHVFVPDLGRCEHHDDVDWACDKAIDCSTMEDGYYADLDNDCHSYSYCRGGTFFGHTFCPSGTVFDESQAFCNWPHNVAPPCGTLSE